MDWDKYVAFSAEEYGVPQDMAQAAFDLLGPEEAYDGFITALQDMEEQCCPFCGDYYCARECLNEDSDNK